MTTGKLSTLRFTFTALATYSALAAACAVAQDQQDQSWMIKPTKQHQLLKKDVGTWDATVKVWPMEGAEPMESKGTEKNRLLKGGLWLITRFEGDVIGMPFIGMGQFGYDPAEKKYVGSWIDTMTPHMMTTKAEYDEETKTMTGVAETRDPVTGEKYEAKMITRYKDDDSHVMEMHRSQNGKEWKVMEISYKRQAKKADAK